jgi:two-component system OmpR family response regulator
MTTTAYGIILLVEDDLPLARWVQEFLQEKGYQVLLEHRGDTVIPLLRRQHIDLILLDLMLPGMNGLDLCRQIRRDYQVPILMLTAQGEEVDEIIGLGVGANDYLVKPVRPRILLARILAALRQTAEPQPSQQLVFGDLTICSSSRRVLLGSAVVALTSAEFALLWYLASHAGQVCSREQVFQALKGREHDGLDRRFDVMISVLRKKLKDDAKEPQRIKTVWGQGYLFVSDPWLL